MIEMNKFILSIILFITGAFLIIFFGLIIPAGGAGGSGMNNMSLMIMLLGFVVCGIGGLVLYLRKVSISSSSRKKRVKKVTMTAIKKPKKSTIKVSTTESPKSTTETSISAVSEKDILCLTCEFYDKYEPKQKCKFLNEKDRQEIIKSGIKCVEYRLHHSLIENE